MIYQSKKLAQNIANKYVIISILMDKYQDTEAQWNSDYSYKCI